MAEAEPFQPFKLLRPSLPGSRHDVSIFCVNCKSLIVKDEDIVEIRKMPYGPEVRARDCEGRQLHPIGWVLDHPSHTESMKRLGYPDAKMMKQKVVCKCRYESEPVKEFYNLKKYNAGYFIFNETNREQPFFDGCAGCVIRYGLNGSDQLVWTGHQRDHALLNYEDGKLMGKRSEEECPASASAVQEFSTSNTQFHLLSTLLATEKGSPYHISLHCNFCHSVLVRPDHIAHISVNETGGRFIWTRASSSDPDGAVIKNLKFFGRKNIHEINTQRMQKHGYWKTTIMFQHVMCKCRHIKGRSFDSLRPFSTGYRLFDKDPRGPGFLDLECDYQLTFRFYEQPPAQRCIVWTGDQSKHVLRSATLPATPDEVEERYICKLVQEGILCFSEDPNREKDERKALVLEMLRCRTCSRHAANDFVRTEEVMTLLKKVQDEIDVKLQGQGFPSTSMPSPSVQQASLVVIPPAILAHGPEATSIYQDLLKKEPMQVRDIRLFLCGEEGVGKTSLRKTILGEDFDPNEQSTKGIAMTASKCSFEVHRWIVKRDTNKHPMQNLSELFKDESFAIKMANKLRAEAHRTRDTKENQHAQLSSLQPKALQVLSSHLDDDQPADVNGMATEGSVAHVAADIEETTSCTPPDLVTSTIHEVNKEFQNIPEDLAVVISQLLDDLSLTEKADEIIRISIWDFAGQDIYYAIHHIFMTYARSIYLLTFRSDQDLHERAGPLARDIVRGKQKQRKSPDSGQMTHIDYIRQWLAAVHFTTLNCSPPNSSPPAQAADCSDVTKDSQDADSQDEKSVPPHVVFVGTHADELDVSLEEKDCNLWDLLSCELGFLDEDSPHPAFCHVSHPSGRKIHLIDNTRSHRGFPPTDEVGHLQDHIGELARSSLAKSETIPHGWVCFERVIRKLEEKHCHMLEVHSIRRILESVCDISEIKEVGLLLQFLCDKGEIALLNPAQPLAPDSKYIISMRWLIERLSEVITVRSWQDEHVMPKYAADWRNLQSRGIVSGKLIKHFWKNAGLTQNDQETLVDFMIRRDLLYETGSDAQAGNVELVQREFIIPSLIGKIGDVDEFISVKDQSFRIFSMEKVPLFFIAQSDPVSYPIPHSMYFRMVVRCLRRWPKSPKLQYNCARFHIAESSCKTDVVLCHEPVRGIIKVVVQRFFPKYAASGEGDKEEKHKAKEQGKEEDEATKTMGLECCEVRRSLMKVLNDLQQVYFPSLTIKTAIACPNEHEACEKHGDESCRQGTCLRLILEHDQGLGLCNTEGKYVTIPENALCWTDKKAQFKEKEKDRHKSSLKHEDGTAVTAEKVIATQSDTACAMAHPDRKLAFGQVSDHVGLAEACISTSSKTSHTALEDIPLKALIDVASKINSQKACVSLAAHLDFDDLEVVKYRNSTKDVDDIAQELLLRWRSRVKGTPKGTQTVLARALHHIGGQELSDFFKEKCKDA